MGKSGSNKGKRSQSQVLGLAVWRSWRPAPGSNFCCQSELKISHLIQRDGVRTSIYLVFLSFECPPVLQPCLQRVKVTPLGTFVDQDSFSTLFEWLYAEIHQSSTRFGFYRNTHNFSPGGISFFPRNLIFVFCFLSYRVTLTSKHLVSHAHSCTHHLLNWGESGPAGQGREGVCAWAGEWRAKPCGMNRLTYEKTQRKQAVCGLITTPLCS